MTPKTQKITKLGIVILLILVLAVIFSGCTKPPKSGKLKIVFESSRSIPKEAAYPQKYIELYSTNADGTDLKRITNNLYWEHKPQVSNGRILVTIHFSAENVKETDPGWEIAILSFDGSLRRLTNNDYFDGNAKWNADGTKIVFVSDSNKRNAEDLRNGFIPQYDIYLMNPDGTGKKRLTYGDAGEVNADPCFSPDGHIYYVHSENYSNNFDLWCMNSDGSGKHVVFRHNNSIRAINDPSPSPDGSKVIFEGRISDDPKRPIYNLFVLNLSDGKLIRITTNDGESDIWPSYSPDGELITYFTYEWDGGHTSGVRVAKADGSEERKISSFPWESFPSWFERTD